MRKLVERSESEGELNGSPRQNKSVRGAVVVPCDALLTGVLASALYLLRSDVIIFQNESDASF